MAWRRFFTLFLLLFSVFLASCLAEGTDSALMTDQEILSELLTLSGRQLTTSDLQQQTLGQVQEKLGLSQQEYQKLLTQLEQLRGTSSELQSLLSSLSSRLEPMQATLSESSSSLQSLSEDIGKEIRSLRLRADIATGVSIATALMGLVAMIFLVPN